MLSGDERGNSTPESLRFVNFLCATNVPFVDVPLRVTLATPNRYDNIGVGSLKLYSR